jgi:hypothetical protein
LPPVREGRLLDEVRALLACRADQRSGASRAGQPIRPAKTGLGDMEIGEGVQGLRLTFMVAADDSR